MKPCTDGRWFIEIQAESRGGTLVKNPDALWELLHENTYATHWSKKPEKVAKTAEKMLRKLERARDNALRKSVRVT